MTDPALRKICPKSGEKCDCPKGICNLFALAGDALTDALDDVYFANQIIHEEQIAFCEDEGCPQFGTKHICISPSEAAKVDRQEAGSLKYAMCAQILMLSSGKFALYGAYSIGEGIPLIAIDTWENLEPHVRAYRKTAEEGYTREKQQEQQRNANVNARAAADYDSLFGEES